MGFSAGSGFDTYARALERYMGKHIAGNPTVIVDNMAGAGSLIAANHVYNVAKPDGLTIGHFIGGLFLGQVLGQKGVEFDARKFEFIGAPITDHVVCAFTKASGSTSVENRRNRRGTGSSERSGFQPDDEDLRVDRGVFRSDIAGGVLRGRAVNDAVLS